MPQPKNISANGRGVRPAALKAGFRTRWSVPDRVEKWTGAGLNSEFGNADCRRAWKAILRRAAAGVTAGTALDVGTGPGTIALLWAELGLKVSGVDFSLPMLDAARRQAESKGLSINYREGDAEDPPFPRQRFGIISSRFVLFTLPHPGYAVRRWVEMLAPGGRLVLIGHEHTEGQTRPEVRQSSHGDSRPAADPAEEKHRENLKLLPFVNHTCGDLQVVMEAAGLDNIQRMPVTALLEARDLVRQRDGSVDLPRTVPYILVGRK